MSMPPPPVTLPNLPAGWSRGNVPSPVVKRALKVSRMRLPYGGGVVDTINGTTYAFRFEPHYDNHPLLRPGQPEDASDAPAPFWHPGVSVWTMREPSADFPAGLDDARPKLARSRRPPSLACWFRWLYSRLESRSGISSRRRCREPQPRRLRSKCLDGWIVPAVVR